MSQANLANNLQLKTNWESESVWPWGDREALMQGAIENICFFFVYKNDLVKFQ